MRNYLGTASKPALAALCLGLVAASADAIVSECSDAALDAALSQGGRILVACNGTITHQSTKVIAQDTLLEAAGGPVTLSGGGSNRLFSINPGVTLTLRGLTLTQGSHQGANGPDGAELEVGANGQPGFGGAIFNNGGTLVAEQVVFSMNTTTGGNGGAGSAGQFLGANGRDGGRGGAATGGAIQNRAGRLLLTNCTFVANQVVGGDGGTGGDGADRLLSGNGGDGGDGGHGRGAAIYSEDNGEVVLFECTFSENAAQGGFGGEPGWAGGVATFDGLPGDAGNGEGGAIYGVSGSVLGMRSTFDQNLVQGADGLDGLDGFDSRSGMDGRRGGAGRGGALAFDAVTAAFTNATFFSNSAGGGVGGNGGRGGDLAFGGDGGDGGRGGRAQGGSVYHGSASAGSYVHCTFSSGLLVGGAGGDGGAAGTATSNPGGKGSTGPAGGANIATDSTAVELVLSIVAYGNGGPNSDGPVNDGGFNLSSDDTPDFLFADSLNGLDPLLSDLAQNGGSTATVAIAPESPARDLGSDGHLVDTDQRGYLRVDLPDSGAFEYAAAPGLGITSQGDLVIVSWPVTVPPLQLLGADSLIAPEWQLLSGAVQMGSVFVITNGVSGTARFYRLTR